MSTRPLPHFAHKPIGKTTRAKGFSYQNINYITRDEACSKIIADNMPDDRSGARPFFERMAYADGVRPDARTADTLIIALPIELSKEQRWEAIRGYMEKIGKGRIAWLAAFHDQGKDAHNPHCHVIFRDADIETGRKVVGTTTSAKDVKETEEHGWRVPPRMTTKDLRVAWCDHLNAEMERHGYDARFDQRKLKEQGIDREPQIHVGPKANAMAEKGKAFESQDRRHGQHANVYSLIDTASRAQHNQRIIEANRLRANGQLPRSPAPGREGLEKRHLRERQAAERKEMYHDQKQDRMALRGAHDAQKLEHQRWARCLYADARKRTFLKIKPQFDEKWRLNRKVADKDTRENDALKIKAAQKEAYGTLAKQEVDAVRPIKNERWQNIKLTQENERKALQQRHLEESTTLTRQQIAERHALHEAWQHRHLDKAAQATSAKLESRQSMASVQAAAVSMIRQHARATRTISGAGRIDFKGSPQEAAAHFAERARAEAASRATIRYELNATRAGNQIRASEPAERRTRAGQLAEQRAQNRAAIHAQRQARQNAGAQDVIRQAAASGRTLTDAEHASASPETKAELAAQDKRDKARRETGFTVFVKDQNSGKGRSGGRSGR